MPTVLVSFIGTGSRSGGEYEATEYFFDGEVNSRETSIFGSALLQFLKSKNRNVDRWLILGTDKSIWSELIKMFPDLFSDDKRTVTNKNYESQREFLENEAIYCQSDKDYTSQISQEKLDEWQKILTGNIENTDVVCRLVGTASTQKSQEKILESLLEFINDGNNVVFDVTHGLRNQPIIVSFALMYLRYLRNIKNVEFYYGAMDLDGKVIKLDFCNQLLEATEAVAIYNQTSNFVKLGESLSLNSSEIEKVSFSNEMNKPDKGTATKVLNELTEKKSTLNVLQKEIEPLLRESLDWQGQRSLADVYKRKADFAFQHEQYFQAIALLWEALLVAGCKKFGITNPTSFAARKDAESKIDQSLGTDDKKTFQIIDYLRNAVMHGTDAEQSRVKQDVEKAIGNREAFCEIFKKGQKLLNNLLA